MKSIFDPDDQVDLALVDAGLGRHLSKLSNNSKHAFTLNQVQRVKVCATYDREDEDGATVYVLDVYLQYVQRGLPTTPGETTSERRSRLQQEKEEAEPEYQVEHRYSAFRELRRRITKIVHDPVEGFPSRFPNRGRWAVYTGWRRLLIHTRKRKLERFVNQILRAAKDLSYRRGGGQCQRFIEVSHILNTFLMDPDLRPEGCVW
ncbi:hypothetical protein JG687_00018423 [Phytophthora cactorum]|uniref:PX domain-containing protein n=1 Tax=Phytophthora cactorum TaxID=29920 RepID=A0A8T1TLQ6_9STRA|nr:hypothetical protein JG687_00018423 [Phytophthora cactorum]